MEDLFPHRLPMTTCNLQCIASRLISVDLKVLLHLKQERPWQVVVDCLASIIREMSCSQLLWSGFAMIFGLDDGFKVTKKLREVGLKVIIELCNTQILWYHDPFVSIVHHQASIAQLCTCIGTRRCIVNEVVGSLQAVISLLSNIMFQLTSNP